MVNQHLHTALPSTKDSLWDMSLLPMEVVETPTSIICTVWVHKLPIQSLYATYTQHKLVIRVTASQQPANSVNYVREVELSAPVASTGANVMLNDTLATITLPKAKSGLIQRIAQQVNAMLHPHRSTSLLGVKAL